MKTIHHSLFTILCISALLAGCSGPQWGQYSTPTPDIATSTSYPTATLIPTPVPPTITPTYDPPTPTEPPTVTPVPTLEGTPKPPVLYYTQSGEFLSGLAVRFGVDVSAITSPDPVPASGLINPGTLLIIPDVFDETTPNTVIMPDSEVVFSATALDFSSEDYVMGAGGFLSTYSQYLKQTSTTTGYEVVDRIAIENSVNPRLLLALLEYESGWVRGQPSNISRTDYPFGYVDFNARDMFTQMVRAVDDLAIGYYEWRAGRLIALAFPDGRKIRIAPELNAGTVALQYYFAQHYTYADWAKALDPNIGFIATYRDMFGDPWERAATIEPLFPPDLTQPALSLPFVPGVTWAFTGGPHAAWEHKGALAAIDFAPGSDESGCKKSAQWIVAPAPGMVVRSGNGIVVLDMDGDGKEQTGWNILFLHVSTNGRAPVGKWLDQNEYIGHPSCEGGIATGTHVHMARKYNGEWVLADGPLAFNLDGWVVHNGTRDYLGSMVRDNAVVEACTCSSYITHIVREP